MRKGLREFKTVDEYIASFPLDVQAALRMLRQAVKEAAPGAEETISYGMPAFRLNGVLVYFAAQKRHIGFYPTSSGVSAFKGELAAYAFSKGTIRFPLGKPIPIELVKRIVAFRVAENSGKAK